MISRPQGVSYYNGYAGECAVSFFKSPPYVSIILLSVIYFITILVFQAPVERFPTSILLLPIALILVHCFAASRFSLSSQKGLFNEGLGTDMVNLEDSLAYTWRLFMASFVYLIPFLSILYLFPQNLHRNFAQFMAYSSTQPPLDLSFSFFLSMSGIILGMIFLAYLIPIAHLVALTTETGLETWSPGHWIYFIRTKGKESLFFAITLFGSLMAIVLSLGAISTSIGLISIPISKGFGFFQFLTSSLFFISISSASILSGRLSGACIFGSNLISNSSESNSDSEPVLTTSQNPEVSSLPISSAVASNTIAPTTEINKSSPIVNSPIFHSEAPSKIHLPEDKLTLEKRIARLATFEADEYEKGREYLNTLLSENPLDLKLSKAETEFYLSHKKLEEAISSTSTTIALALKVGASGVALDSYIALGGARLKLNLEPTLFERLGKILFHGEHYRDAVWCFFQYGQLSKDTATAESLVLDVAKSAETKLSAKEVLPLYRFILKYFPETQQRAYIEKVIEFNKAK